MTLVAAKPAEAVEVLTLNHLIAGKWVAAQTGETFQRHSPATGAVVSLVAKGTAADAADAIAAARTTFDTGVWSQWSGKERARVLLRMADLIDKNSARIARYETLESGKPISQAAAEIEGAADLWRYAASLARNIRGTSQNTLGRDILGLTLKEPVGVVSMITPWNFPFLIASQKVPFALAAGCTVVLKPSELTSATTVMMGELLLEAGCPAGAVNIVLGFGDPVGNTLSAHADVDMVSFTGSTGVGKAIVAATSGTLKKVSLELGGKNPQVIFPDADLDQVADAIVFGAYFNAGACCNAGSRIIVHRDVADALVDTVIALSLKVPFGDPLDPRTKVGALISGQHQSTIHARVRGAEAAGATIKLGGAPLAIDGLAGPFYAPTVITGVTPQMAIAHEEVFGPVLAVLTFDTFDEAVALTNATSYGLSAGVWSRDVSTCLAFARAARTGTVWTNTFMDGFAELPFGGVKESGIGRELGPNGLEEFLETKTVQMRIGDTRPLWV
ncbi:MAG: aldehyde dehydrogenase family protein [Pseudomonadota bacterium]